MSDIVARLRDGAASRRLVTTGLVNQAADEITRLRAEVAWHVADKNKWQDTQAAHLAEITRLRAEVEKLKAALTLSDAIWPLAYRDIAELAGADFSDQTLDAWRAYDAARADLGDTP